jgi:hypothetical protein
VWQSTDKLTDKYPNMSSYAYVANNPINNVEINGDYWAGTDGQPVAVHRNEKGKITVGPNASKDLKRYVDMVNKSKSTTAVKQFMKVAENKTKVNFKIEKEPTDKPSMKGLHQAHDKEGPIGWKSGPNGTGQFERMPDYIDDGNGNKVYREATITIYEGNIKSRLGDTRIKYKDPKLTADEYAVMTGAHEADHDTNHEAIDALRERQGGSKNTYNVEKPAYEFTDKVHQEIKENRSKPE